MFSAFAWDGEIEVKCEHNELTQLTTLIFASPGSTNTLHITLNKQQRFIFSDQINAALHSVCMDDLAREQIGA